MRMLREPRTKERYWNQEWYSVPKCIHRASALVLVSLDRAVEF